MKKFKYSLCSLGLLLFFTFLFSTELESVQADSFGSFSAQAVIPDNQVDKRLSYFDLRLSPEQTQTIQVLVTNSSNEPIVANLQLNAASTGSNGIILYNGNYQRDQSMVTSINEVATLQETAVEIAPNSSEYVGIDINMPKEAFDGVILGGITVTAKPLSGEANLDEAKNVQVTNDYAYTIGLKITENDQEVEPDLNLLEVRPALSNYATSIIARLQNPQPLIMSGMSVIGQIYSKGSSELLYETELDTASMAPNSGMDFTIDCDNQALKPGVYRLYLKAVYEGQEWEWDEEFEITSQEAKDLNAEAVNTASSIFNWSYMLIIFLVLIVVTGMIFYHLGKKKTGADKRES